MKKIESLLETGSDTENKYMLQRCAYCDKLYSLQSQDKLVCSKAEIFIDFHGSVIAKHMPDRGFDFKKFIWYATSKKIIENRILLWRILAWGLLLYCKECLEWFPAIKYLDCRYHPGGEPFFQYGSNIGFFKCC